MVSRHLAVATGSWLYRDIRRYCRAYRAAFGTSTQTRAQKVMIMLVESGILYMLFFVRVPSTAPTTFPSDLLTTDVLSCREHQDGKF